MYTRGTTKNTTTLTLVLLASLAVAFLTAVSAAQAQYMVIEGGSSSSFAESNNQTIAGQSIYAQDYERVHGVHANEEQSLSSVEVINGLFDGFIGVFGTCIGMPAIIIAALRLFVGRQTSAARRKIKSFDLPAPPQASQYYRPSLSAKY